MWTFMEKGAIVRVDIPQEDGLEPLQESSIPSRSRKRDGRLTVRLLSLSRKLDYAIVEIYGACYDRHRAANMTLLSVECVESVEYYGIRGGKPEEVQSGADFTYPCFTKWYAIPAMLVEDD